MRIHKNRKRQFHMISILLMAVFFCFATGCGKNEITVPSYDDELEPADEVSMFAIVSCIDEVNGKITLRAVNYQTEVELSYNGGADIKDKYGEIMSMSQVGLGSVVDVVYDANRNKLLELSVSSYEKVKQLKEISGAEIDYVEKTMRINDRKYQLSDNVTAFSDNVQIGLDEICSEDQLTVWLYNDRICSLYVELGHGYVRLSDYASYIGGMVEIGYDVIVPVTEDMLLTVREGTYTLRIAKGDDVGTKKVEVIKNQEIDLSLADIAIEPKQMGSILFKLTPSDAAVYIDGKRVNTEGAVDVVYGKHKIYITADGYETYSASFNVNYAYKIKEYSLQKSGSTTEKSTSTTKTENSTSQTNSTGTTESTTTESAATESKTTESNTTEKKTDSDVKDVTTATGTKTSNKVTVATPSGASIYFDGEYIGIAPMSFTKVTGSHIITLSKLGYLSKSYTVTFTDDGKDQTLQYDELTSISSLIE